MFTWLTDLIPFGLGTVDKLTEKLKNLVATLWSALVSFFTEQMNAAAYVGREAEYVVSQSIDLAYAVYQLGWWLAYKSLPSWAQNIITQLVQWTTEFVTRLVDSALYQLGQLAQWAEGQLAKARAEVLSFVAGLRQDINSIYDVLVWVRDKVVQLLTDPSALAQWIFQPLISYAMQWARDNAVALGRWALGSAVSMAVRGAGYLEDLIVQII